jgi:sorting nexin-29
MLELGIPPKLVRLTQATIEGTTAKVKMQNELSESFRIRNGLRQGDALACILLNMALEKIIREANTNQRDILQISTDISICRRY